MLLGPKKSRLNKFLKETLVGGHTITFREQLHLVITLMINYVAGWYQKLILKTSSNRITDDNSF